MKCVHCGEESGDRDEHEACADRAAQEEIDARAAALERGTPEQLAEEVGIPDPPCGTCLEYRRGERENSPYGDGGFIHACERIPDGFLPDFCPCGCEMRDPGIIALDQTIFGNAFLNAKGGRMDPAQIRPVGNG